MDLSEANQTEHPKRAAFLAAIAECPSVRGAARAAEISRTTHYEWMKEQDYKRAFEVAWERGKQALHDTAVERANEGKSDVLLIFLLKGAYPETYRERWDGHLSGKDGGPIEHSDVSARQLLADRIAAELAGGGEGQDTCGTDGETMPGSAV